MEHNSQIIIYTGKNGQTKLDVRLEDETVWLTQAQICDLFQKSKATISEHIKHIFQEGELDENSVIRKFRTTASDEKKLIIIIVQYNWILNFFTNRIKGKNDKKKLARTYYW